MKQVSLLRPALAVAFTLVLAGSAFAADTEKSSPVIAKGRASTSAPSATCTDSSGKPVTDPSVCASGMCKDSSGKPVSDPAACAASVSGGPRNSGWDLKSNTK